MLIRRKTRAVAISGAVPEVLTARIRSDTALVGGRMRATRVTSVRRAELTVASVTETGHDERPFIEVAVDRRRHDVQIHAGRLEMLDAFGCSEHARDIDRAFCATINENLATVGKRAPGREHRVEHDTGAATQIMGQLRHILAWFVGLLIALNTDNCDVGIWEQLHRCRQHPETCTENRHKYRTICKRHSVSSGERRRHFAGACWNSSGCLGDHHQGQPPHLRAEHLIRSVLIAEVGKCFLGNRMIDDSDLNWHGSILAQRRWAMRMRTASGQEDSYRAATSVVCVRVSTVTNRAGCEAAGALFDRVWGMVGMVPNETIIATLHAGGHASLAEVDGEVVGATWGFVARHQGLLGLHSHVTGVIPERGNKGVGLALKHHQWQWAKSQNLDFVTWTFDPLVRRNAYFNLVKLGATVTEYHEDFYGAISDGLNRGERTDRVFVSWPVSGRDAPPIGAVVSGAEWVIATPPDIESLRRTDTKAAHAWRDQQRADLRKAFDGSWRLAGLTSDGSYAVIKAR